MRLRYLDSLRGIAVLGVLLLHSAVASDQPVSRFSKLSESGQRGVQLFYLVSAFSLFLALDTRRAAGRTKSTGDFFVRRFFRIAPMFYLAVVANLFLRGLSPRDGAPNGISVGEVVLGIVFLNGVDPDAINSVAIGGWSIAVEAMFYLMVPFLFSRINTLVRALVLAFASCIVCPVISYGLRHHVAPDRFNEYFEFLWFPVQFPIFCMGIVAYQIWKLLRNYEHLGLQQNTSPLFDRKLWSALLVLLSLEIFVSSLPNGNPRLYWSSSAFIPLLLALSLHDWRLFVNSVTAFLGKISYSMYLMHYFMMLAIARWFFPLIESKTHFGVFRTPLGFFSMFLMGTVSTAAVSTFTYFTIERPGMRIGQRLISLLHQKSHSKRGPLLDSAGLPSIAKSGAAERLDPLQDSSAPL